MVLVTRPALLALQRFHQRGFFAADVGARTQRIVDGDIDAAAANVLAEQARRFRVVQRLLHVLERFVVELATQIVVGNGRTRRVAGDRHAFQHRVRIEAQDVAVLAGAGLGFVRIAQDVFLSRCAARHERPFHAGREARAAASAQRTLLQLVHDRGRIGLFSQDFFPRLPAAGLAVTVDRPRRIEMQRGVDDLVLLGFGTVCHIVFALVGAGHTRDRRTIASIAAMGRSYRVISSHPECHRPSRASASRGSGHRPPSSARRSTPRGTLLPS